jgi:predicted HAD superfamily phosphohydrolase YqeG
MVGDNFLTDGGCRKIGMKFIHVKPIPGSEKFMHRTTRKYGHLVSRFHDLFR